MSNENGPDRHRRAWGYSHQSMAALVIVLVMLVGAPAFAADRVSNMYAHQVDLLENDLVSLARAMPAEKYDFRPTNGTFTSARTFGEQVKHIATMIYMTAAIVLEEKPPYGPGPGDNGPPSIQGKDQILARRRASRSQPASRTTATITTVRWSCTRG
jgi:hypothetical protein